MKETKENLNLKRIKQKGKVEELKRNKKAQGITLIALVVTIVVLLILAGITINMLFSNGGIFKTAQDAANAWNQAVINEQADLDNLEEQIENLVNGQIGGGTGENENIDPETGWDLDKVTKFPSKDEPSVNVPIPDGFTASTVEEEQKVEEGFVIKQDGTNNEFVWIPVNNEQLGIMYNTENPGTALSAYEGVDATTDVYSKLRGAYGASTGGAPGSTTYREPDILTNTTYGDAITGQSDKGIEQIKSVFGFEESNGNILDQFADMLVADYEASYESIKKYGGFYIGRYEITGSVVSPTVQKGQTVLTGQNWYNLYKACNGIVNTANAKSTMINGTQWDRVMEWLVETGTPSEDVYEDSSTWGNYKNYNSSVTADKQVTDAGTKVFPAGSSENWKANNIYDLAGNAWEWTQEAFDNYDRIVRGGVYNNSGSAPAWVRLNYGYTYSTYNDISTHPILYIK